LTLIENIKDCKKNDSKAQRKLYDLYAPSLFGVCLRFAKDKSEAEDILQDGFLKIFLYINQFNGTGSFDGWVKRIMINTAISHYKNNLKYSRNENIDKVKEMEYSLNNPETEFSHFELIKLIRELPKGCQMIFNLYAIEGFKHKEIAQMLGIDEGTSKSQYSKAKRIMQDKLNKLQKMALTV
jgi:RNA polymerase sigma factor (sigma-70 family)